MARMTRFDRTRADADIRKAKTNVAQQVRKMLADEFAKGGLPDSEAVGQAVAELAFRGFLMNPDVLQHLAAKVRHADNIRISPRACWKGVARAWPDLQEVSAKEADERLCLAGVKHPSSDRGSFAAAFSLLKTMERLSVAKPQVTDLD